MQTTGNLPEMLLNKVGLYEGDLKAYFKIISVWAKNLRLPYHNLRHMLHVTWLCYQACIYYKSQMTKVEMRNLLIAALFHDFNHRGSSDDDDLNIEAAVRGLKKHILEEDKDQFEEISALIRITKYPYDVSNERLTNLSQKIIRDADLCQVFSVAWIQQVVFGLADEWNQEPLEVLKLQPHFLKNIEFNTKWAKNAFNHDIISSKIKEAQELFEILK